MGEYSTLVAEILGYAAALMVFMAFALRSIASLRAVAIVSNILFIAYALTAHLMPVLLLHVLLLPMNVWRLWQILRQKSAAGSLHLVHVMTPSTLRQQTVPLLRALRYRSSDETVIRRAHR